jgi:potassium efflux system protein
MRHYFSKFHSVNILILVLFLMVLPSTAQSQETKETRAGEESRYSFLLSSLENAITAEKANSEKLKNQLAQAKQVGKTITSNLNIYNAQLSAHGNLLLLPETGVKRLEETKAGHLFSLDNISGQLESLTESFDTVVQMRIQAEEQFSMNEKQLADIKKKGVRDLKTIALQENLKELINLISEKKMLIDKLEAFYKDQIGQLIEVRQGFQFLAEKLETRIKAKKTEELFQRNGTPLALLKWKQISKDIYELADEMRSLASIDSYLPGAGKFKEYGYAHALVLIALFITALVLMRRFRQFCIRVEQTPFFIDYPQRRLTFQVFHRSILLIGITLFFYALEYIRSPVFTPGGIRIVVYVLVIWLSTRWWLDFLRIRKQDPVNPIPRLAAWYLGFITRLIRYYAAVYVILAWLIGGEKTIPLIMQLAFEFGLLGWYVLFIRNFRHPKPQSSSELSRFRAITMALPVNAGYIIAGGGLILDLIGYGSFALYWNISCGRTAVVLLWGFLFLSVLKEWGQHLRQVTDKQLDVATKTAYPIRWFANRLCWLVWFLTLSVSISFAWGARQTVIVSTIQVLQKTIKIGNISLNLMNLLFVFLILFITLGASRIWQNVLSRKILAVSGLEPGLKESIVTISVYLLWGISIVLALNILGVSSTSLAVVFGALSIGLGFGLQNIFNNFISGIILLFERPIQVGDDVELNGIWGEVKKINVRATVVQTYDNASLIIPNSEFISSQVTNWSFKDLRIRRKIAVGVAYGSDTELTRNTLLEVAEKNTMILRYPKPDVLFQDFGDSALIFILRIWTNVKNMLTVESNVRFEIDRLFRKRGIEIAFPQQDLHIRSITGTDKLLIESEDKTRLEPQAKK